MKTTSTKNRFNLSIYAIAATLLALVTPLFAQSGSPSIRVNVPFPFYTASRHLNPGVYQIRLASEHTILIQGLSAKFSSFSMTNDEERRKPPMNSSLTFHRYGNRYFLSEVALAGRQTTRRCIKGKAEKETQLMAAIPSPANTEVAINQLP